MFATEPAIGSLTLRNPDSPLQHFFLSTTHNLFLSELNFQPCLRFPPGIRYLLLIHLSFTTFILSSDTRQKSFPPIFRVF
jgi:hypothetical protein